LETNGKTGVFGLLAGMILQVRRSHGPLHAPLNSSLYLLSLLTQLANGK